MATGFTRNQPKAQVPNTPSSSTPTTAGDEGGGLFIPKPLTIELVPRTCWYSNVRSEVPAAVWEKLKRHTSKLAGNRCEVCGGRGPKWPVECHEVWLFVTPPPSPAAASSPNEGRVQALCPDCHLVKHIGRAQVTGQGERAFRHLAKVNGWSLEDAEHGQSWVSAITMDHVANLEEAQSEAIAYLKTFLIEASDVMAWDSDL